VTGIGYTAAVALAAMFLIASFSKLGAPQESAAGFAAFGLPAPKLLAVVLPIVEIGLAILLLIIPWLGGAIALGILTLFTAVLVNALRHGIAAPCNCFGTNASNKNISWFEVARNGILMLGAFCALFATKPIRPYMNQVGIVALGVCAVVGLTIWRNVLDRRPTPPVTG
jgi:uncharacterized membrane protein YphA (DoxX/SURF4 family)